LLAAEMRVKKRKLLVLLTAITSLIFILLRYAGLVAVNEVGSKISLHGAHVKLQHCYM
jgi:hypothetical protein